MDGSTDDDAGEMLRTMAVVGVQNSIEKTWWAKKLVEHPFLWLLP